jgi:hemerythrin-like domain-containing protein
MLTATYSLVAFTTEHDNMRRILSRLQQYIETTWKGLQDIDFAFLDTTFGRLMQLDKYCRERKLERYLIPALRNVCREAEALIAELDALGTKAATLLNSVYERLHAAFDSVSVNELCESMESYCRCLSMKFDKEEKELLPLARRVLSVEDWFSVAAQLLSDDSGASTHRSGTSAARSPRPMANAG